MHHLVFSFTRTLEVLVVLLALVTTAHLVAAEDNHAPQTIYITLTSTVTTSTTTIYPDLSTIQSSTAETTTVLASTSLSTTAIATASTGAMAYTTSFESDILNSTNYYRAQHQAKAMTWNSTLADFAQNHSSACIWEHSGGPYGENLAENYATSAEAVDAWANEEHDYDYAKAKFSESTGHFSQLVWKNTTQVGCGVTKCSNDAGNGANGWFLVCEYSPRGNIAGSFASQVSKPGERSDGELGFGSGSSFSRKASGALRALVAFYIVLAMCV